MAGTTLSPPGSPTSQPLLRNHSDSEPFLSPKRSSHVAICALEDGGDSEFSSEDDVYKPRPGFWRRLRMSMRRRSCRSKGDDCCRQLRLSDEKPQSRRFRLKRKHAARACVIIPLLVLIFFGLLHILNVVLGYVPTFLDGKADPNAFDWDKQNESTILDITRDVTPVPCHSHNDYWRRVPLYDALRWGCTGVEADVWLFDNELLVGHSTNALTQNNTFRSMYVDPLVRMLNHKNEIGQFTTSYDVKNGVFDTEPARTLVLLVDFKSNGHEIFPIVSEHLSSLRKKGYLTYYDGNYTIEGPVTVVATGNAPFDLVTANKSYRDIFFDAPLDKLASSPPSTQPHPDNVVDLAKRTPAPSVSGGQGTVGTTPSSVFDATNSYYASVNFGRSIGWLWFGHISETQLLNIRSQIREARKRGLHARYWGAPKWPVALRNKVWRMLVEEGVGYLNGDDLRGMASLDWGVRRLWGILGE